MKYTDVREILDHHAQTMLRDPRLGLTGLGAAHPDGARPGAHDDWCLLAHVADPTLSECESLEDYATMLEAHIRDLSGAPEVVVRVERRRKHRAFQEEDLTPTLDTRRWFQTPCIGISITNAEAPSYDDGALTVGTLGMFARQGDARLLLSNNHVLADENRADLDTPIVQPGTLDLTDLEQHLMGDVASLTRNIGVATLTGFVPLQFESPEEQPVNHVDLAWATLTEPPGDEDLSLLAYSGRCVGIGPGYTEGDDGTIRGDTHVYKVGRTTGYTEGEVVAIHYHTTIAYDRGDGYFRDQIAIEATRANAGAFSLPGDSGSAILDSHHRLAALLFGGGDVTTVASPIQTVIENLPEGMQLITSPTPAPDAEEEKDAPQAAVMLKKAPEDAPASARLVAFQNEATSFVVSAVSLDAGPLPIPLALSLEATDSEGHTAKLDAPTTHHMYGVTVGDDGAPQFVTLGASHFGEELMVINRMGRGALDISLLRGGVPVSAKTNVSPQQMASFVKPNEVAIAVYEDVERGDVVTGTEALSEVLTWTPKVSEVAHVKLKYDATREVPYVLRFSGPVTQDE